MVRDPPASREAHEPANEPTSAPPGSPTGPAPRAATGPAPLGMPAAQLLAYAGLALLGAAVLVATSPGGALGARLAHHAFDAGQLLSAGFFAYLVTRLWGRLWERLGPAGEWVRAASGYLALGALALAVGAFALAEDVEGYAQRATGSETAARLLQAALVVVGSASVPAAAFAGRLAGRPRLRPLAVLVAAAAALANHLVLPGDYAGVHLFVAWSAATLAGSSLASARLFAPPPRPALAAGAALFLLASLTLVVRPSPGVLLLLLRSPGAVLAPFVARLHDARARPELAEIDAELLPWFTERSSAPPVPPTGERLLPKNGITLLLLVDSMRDELLADPAYADDLPELFRLRDESAWFPNARSPGSQTAYAIPALFAGKYFSQMYWSRYDTDLWPHADDSVRFPRLLADAGVATVTFASARWLINEFGAVRGFTEEEVVNPKTTRKRAPDARELVGPTIARLERAEGPVFVFLHLMDAHSPHDRAGKKGTLFERYVRELAIVDREIGRLRRALEKRGAWERTAVVVSADHGEAFGEHGDKFHGHTLYDELLRVPLLVRVPGLPPRRVDAPVSLIDVGPTILDLYGLPTPGSFMGESLVPLMRGKRESLSRPIAAEGRLKQSWVFPNGLKVIRDGRHGNVELYDLEADPNELDNLYGEGRGARELAILDAFFETHRLRRPGYKTPYRK